jgi:2-methylcitrate dehydratase PrpD
MTTLADQLAAAVVEQAGTPLPADVRREAERSLLNVLGTAVGASTHPLVDHVLAVAAQQGGPAVAPVPGRAERADASYAALATGAAAHVDDFDDTHLATVIHAGASSLGAALAVAAWQERSGAELLSAFALACEVQLRAGVAISPAHYDEGWHITGTCGVLGAAAAASLLLGHDAATTAAALAFAAHQTIGQREGFGTQAKAIHAGKAAANGVLCALLAPTRPVPLAGALEAPGGFCGVLARTSDPALLLDGFGTRWELLRNTYKPYPCGIVAHPGIDAAVELAPQLAGGAGAGDGAGDGAAIERVAYSCHPLVPELMGRRDPADHLQARFSAMHGVAVGLLDGRAGIPEFSDERACDADVARVRERTRFVVREDFARDEAAVDVVLADGRRLQAHVAHARGSEARPLTDAELHAKVRALAEPLLPDAGNALIAAVDGLVAAPTLAPLLAAVAPQAAGVEA